MAQLRNPAALLWIFLLSFILSALPVHAQDCSALSPCATGCCNKFGYCGVGDDYCGANCVTNCDYRPECDASNPCTTGCCNKWGYCGLGPDYCADDVCVAGCDSRAECDPGGYGEFADKAKCPLNVCCSKFGFCGTTKEFCGTKKVKRPSCSKNGEINRVVGYYEGWSMRRVCHSFYPEQIPRGVYTHLNYAFASIDPETFQVIAPNSYEKKMMMRLTDLKESDPDLKVYIAVGGWTFNDPGPTATVFSDIARSTENQKAFFKSLISFLSTYNFDGIDLDWEYPVADDRSGRSEDYKNFPSFISNLKSALKASGGRDGLSITLPASYWYLQHFDIVKLQKHVDFFNIMSYDLHGAWDQNNKWLAPELNSHTNLTEITNALDLLWRNDIQPQKVVLGLAFYARVFSATSPSCLEPGCTFESGGAAGACSSEVGILLNSEIVDIMDERQIKPTLDKDAAVQILKFDDNQWLTYDDGYTFKLKVDFARGQCLGGVMVWAVSHDLPHGNFSRILGDTVNRKVKALAMNNSTEELETRTVHAQCKWTNCFEPCPAGWSLITRRDSDKTEEDEGMYDTTGCAKAHHTFCCPPDAPLPTCGWYGHRNGKCNGRNNCPENTVEIGSNSQHCNNGDYQAACCTYDTPSMKLYSQCNWAESPDCDSGVCSNTLMAESSSGSGGDQCRMDKYNGGSVFVQESFHYGERKYCCDQEKNIKWEDCQWYSDVGPALVVKDHLDKSCASGCPDDRVRVALDTRNECAGGSGRARCCKPSYVTIMEIPYTDEELRIEQAVKNFMKDGSCGVDDYLPSNFAYGNLSTVDIAGLSAPMPRFDSNNMDVTYELLRTLAMSSASAGLHRIWKENVVSLYPHLTIAKINAYMSGKVYGALEGATGSYFAITCSMASFNAKLGDLDPIVCPFDNDEDEEEEEEESEVEIEGEEGTLMKKLEPRARRVPITRVLGQLSWRTQSSSYRSRSEWPANHAIWNSGYMLLDDPDCFSAAVGTQRVTASDPVQAEHILEIRTIPDFGLAAYRGVLPSGRVITSIPRLSADFIVNGLSAPILTNPPPMVGGQQSNIPIDRIYNALGSMSHDTRFVLLSRALNGVKTRLWSERQAAWSNSRMMRAAEAPDPTAAINYLRSVPAVINYLNQPIIHANLANSSNEVRSEFDLAAEAWQAKGNPREHAGEWWSIYVRDHLHTVGLRSRNFVDIWGRNITNHWAVRTGPMAAQVLEAVESHRNANMTINQDDID